MAYRINTPNVTSEILEGEVVAINLEKGYYYSIDKVGAIIWDCINKNISAEEIAKKLSKALDIAQEVAKADIDNFTKELKQENLIVEHDLPVKSAEVSIKKIPYEKPKLTKFEDMQDLLLLDPIHDVDEKGWPNKPAA